jgi:hypothetical protein
MGEPIRLHSWSSGPEWGLWTAVSEYVKESRDIEEVEYLIGS